MDVTGIIKFLAILIVLSWVSGRLLDVRRPWPVKLFASFLGFFLGLLLTLLISFQNSNGTKFWQTPEFILTLVLSALGATLVIFVALEVLVRPTRRVSKRSTSIPRPIHAIRGWAARTRRYFQITGIAAHYGLVSIFRHQPSSQEIRDQPIRNRQVARNLRAALQEAGGVFIKLGQVMSTRPDVLPPDFVAELTGLQDHVAPVPIHDIEALFMEEFGKSSDQMFAEFDIAPIAAASIAQAHKARLSTGEQVVVKVQRPGIKFLVERDLDILLRLARTAEARAAWGRDFRAVELAEGFSAALREELDFKIEAQNIKAVMAATPAHAKVRIPKVYPGLLTSRVLVMEWFDGVSIRDGGALLDSLNIDRAELARELLRYIMHQMLFEGTFHADPHAGNIMVLRDGQLALIDFGMVCRLNPIQQLALRRMWIALERRDAVELSAAILEVAQVREDTDEYELEYQLAQFMTQRLGQGMEINGALIMTLFQLLQTFGLGFSAEISAVFRALMMLDGTLKLLAPDFQLITEARTLAMEWLRESLTPQELVPTITDELRALLPLLTRLPKRMDHIANALEHGSLSANVRLFADKRDTAFILRLVNQTTLAFMTAAMGIISSILIGTTGGPVLTAALTLPHALGYFGLFVSIILMMRVIVLLVRS